MTVSNANRPSATKIGKLNQEIASARANQGFGSLGKWPDPIEKSQEHTVRLVGLEVDWAAKYEYGRPNAQGGKPSVDGVRFQFSYEWDNPATGAAESFKGVPKIFAYDADELPGPDAGKKWGPREFSRDMHSKVKGDIDGLLGAGNYSDVETAVLAIQQMIADANNGGAAIWINLYTSYSSRQYKDKDGQEKTAKDRHDFIRGIVSGPAPAAPAA